MGGGLGGGGGSAGHALASCGRFAGGGGLALNVRHRHVFRLCISSIGLGCHRWVFGLHDLSSEHGGYEGLGGGEANEGGEEANEGGEDGVHRHIERPVRSAAGFGIHIPLGGHASLCIQDEEHGKRGAGGRGDGGGVDDLGDGGGEHGSVRCITRSAR